MRFQVPPKTFTLDSRITQRIGPATEKARRLCQMCCDETNCGIFSLRRLAERRCWRPETSETVTQQSVRHLGARYRRHRWTVTASLYCTRCGIVSQCRSSHNSRDRPCWRFWVTLIRRAAAFWTRCNLSVIFSRMQNAFRLQLHASTFCLLIRQE